VYGFLSEHKRLPVALGRNVYRCKYTNYKWNESIKAFVHKDRPDAVAYFSAVGMLLEDGHLHQMEANTRRYTLALAMIEEEFDEMVNFIGGVLNMETLSCYSFKEGINFSSDKGALVGDSDNAMLMWTPGEENSSPTRKVKTTPKTKATKKAESGSKGKGFLYKRIETDHVENSCVLRGHGELQVEGLGDPAEVGGT
jgi:hypothetical protein